jgi:hypothetical protein
MLSAKQGTKMAVDWDYAYNYWRKVFTESCDGKFSKADFDEWFRNGSEHASDSMSYFATVDVPGSKEHFDIEMRTAFINMLQACAEGRFGK